jgi:adducin
LIKIDINGEIVDGGSTTFNINKSLFNIQSAVYKTRPDIKCILHIQTPSTTAISSLKCGLLQISRESILCGNISYHEFKGSDSYLNELYIKSLLCDDLGPLNKIMFIRNYGVLIFGETIEESWYYLCNCISACESQLRIMSAGLDNLYLPNDELKKRFIQNSIVCGGGDDCNGGRKWKLGEVEFEACMRCLDNAVRKLYY